MGLPVIRSNQMSIAEYLRRERDSLEKHEYRDGEALLMAGGTANHSLIVANVIGELRGRLKGTPCRVYDGNLRVRIPPTVLFTYPDLSIICGQRRLDAQDGNGETVTNPRVIIEVLSPTTEGYDRGEKFSRYRQLDSLEEYVLVSQQTPRVESFLRQAGGTWLLTAVEGVASVANIRCLNVELPLSEVYAGVEFGLEQETPG